MATIKQRDVRAEAKFWVRELRELFEELKRNCDFYEKRLNEIETKYKLNKQKEKQK